MAKNHRQNSNFQILYFLVGSCHTPDGAYALLCDLLEEREMALDNFKVNQLRQEAKKMEANNKILSNGSEIKEGQAILLEMELNEHRGQVLYDAAVDEVEFIKKCMKDIQPFRKYAHLPDPQAHELSQREEWKMELIFRAENQLMTTGAISPDHISTMRMHPDFISEILPKIDEMKVLIATSGSPSDFMLNIEGNKQNTWKQSLNSLQTKELTE